MLGDPKVRGLATEFAGQWLDFRRFEEHNAVDRERYPSFTNELRQAMFEEPVRYFMDVAQKNRSVLDLIYGKDTFVNPVLAKHYGMPYPGANSKSDIRNSKQIRSTKHETKVFPASTPLFRISNFEFVSDFDIRDSDLTNLRSRDSQDWIRIDDADRYGRGGLLPMAVFLTKNAPGLRTSPVKRGYWVVRRLLGERIPPPPPTVPELPKDEAQFGELTLPQLLARHRADASCAGCHRRFDSVGLVFEGFGPIGELRTKDLAGHEVQTSGTFPDGVDRAGLEGLRTYLREKRQDDFLNSVTKKLFAYALGRTLLVADKKALDGMRSRLVNDGYRFQGLVEEIVASPQFLNVRGVE
jgi:uncharacterized protein DUF1588/uncharacterized protein DUF1592/uncharacterized protein DUF1585